MTEPYVILTVANKYEHPTHYLAAIDLARRKETVASARVPDLPLIGPIVALTELLNTLHRDHGLALVTMITDKPIMAEYPYIGVVQLVLRSTMNEGR